MSTTTDLNTLFEELVTRYTRAIEKNYRARYKKAKDKEFVLDELKTDASFMLGWTSLDPVNSKVIDKFLHQYKRGEDIADILKYIREAYGEIDDIKFSRKMEDGKKIPVYLDEEEKALKHLALNKRKLLKIFIRDTAYRKIQQSLPTMFSEELSVKHDKEKTYPVKWTNKKDNKNEFVQLIYGLHKAGLINEGKGEITKIIETLADSFQLNLGKGWQANHSASIHKAKHNYQAPIFRKIQEAYQQYSEELIQDKKKK